MKIEIDYNGAFATCRIEQMGEPGKMVNFNDADINSQIHAMSAFQTIKKHWQREHAGVRKGTRVINQNELNDELLT